MNNEKMLLMDPELLIDTETTAAVFGAGDEDHAVVIADETGDGPAGSMFARDAGRGCDVAPRSETETVRINGPQVSDEILMSFRGTMASGYDRVGGSATIDELIDLRQITVEDPDRHDPI